MDRITVDEKAERKGPAGLVFVKLKGYASRRSIQENFLIVNTWIDLGTRGQYLVGDSRPAKIIVMEWTSTSCPWPSFLLR